MQRIKMLPSHLINLFRLVSMVYRLQSLMHKEQLSQLTQIQMLK